MEAVQTDEQLLAIDLTATIRTGLTFAGLTRRLFAEGAVAAAIHADRSGVQPASLAFLSEIVRRGGVAYACGVPEPLPTAEQSALVRLWLDAASGVGADNTFARWLDAVAMILGARHAVRLS